jgi:hypothetical protein
LDHRRRSTRFSGPSSRPCRCRDGNEQKPGDILALLDGLGFTLVVHKFTECPMGGRDRGRYAIVAEKLRPAPAALASE